MKAVVPMEEVAVGLRRKVKGRLEGLSLQRRLLLSALARYTSPPLHTLMLLLLIFIIYSRNA
jgi:hypothetical protein